MTWALSWGWVVSTTPRPLYHRVKTQDPLSYTKGTGSLPGVIRLGRGADYPLLSSVEVKETVKLRILSLGVFVACSRVDPTFILIP